jgi:hypothetical protein
MSGVLPPIQSDDKIVEVLVVFQVWRRRGIIVRKSLHKIGKGQTVTAWYSKRISQKIEKVTNMILAMTGIMGIDLGVAVQVLIGGEETRSAAVGVTMIEMTGAEEVQSDFQRTVALPGAIENFRF